MVCDGCGAGVDPRVEACPYCRRVTAYGAHMRDYRAHQEVAAAHHRWAFWHHARMQGVGQAQRSGGRALVAAILGFFPCFLGMRSLPKCQALPSTVSDQGGGICGN